MNSEVNQLARALDLSLGGWAGTTRESRHGFYSVKDDGAAARSLGVGGMHGGRADGVGLDAFMHGYGGQGGGSREQSARYVNCQRRPLGFSPRFRRHDRGQGATAFCCAMCECARQRHRTTLCCTDDRLCFQVLPYVNDDLLLRNLSWLIRGD